MSLSAGEIAAVVAELQPLLGSRVDAVRAHGERSLTLDLYGQSGAATLLLSAEADRTRIHAALRRPPPTPEPLAFQALLRHEIVGAELTALSARHGDRVVELALARPSGAVRLVAELTGRHGNLFLVGADGLVVASAARSLSRSRELAPGKPYLPPAEQEREAARDRPPLVPLAGSRFPLSAAIEERYRAAELDRELAEGRRRLREPVRAARARLDRALAKLAAEAARIPVAEEDRRAADLLKANLHAIPRGAREVTLTSWTERGPEEVTVRLDPALTARQSMERAYRRYRRIVESTSRVAARDAEVRARQGELAELLERIDLAAFDELPRLEREARRLEAGPRPPPRPRSRRDAPLPPYRLFRSIAGMALMVGRNAGANDALTVRVARGNDLWLHVRAPAGSHVVVRTEKGRAPDGETVLDAAHLAAWFSDARGEPQVEVVATLAKYVRKVKGAAPGAVTYSQERTILLRAERQRTERLLAGEEEAEG